MFTLNPKVIIAVSALSLFLLLPVATLAQSEENPDKGNTVALVFAYQPEPGMEQLFREGYRRHLEWHEEHKDPLTWYAWFVVAGRRTGLFIDGTFGIPFAAIDKRIDPADDAADFAQTTAPFAETAFRTAYTLRREISTGTPLENISPSPMIQVFHYTLHTGREAEFENVVTAVKSALEGKEETPVFTWYEVTVGAEHPGYMLMIARNGWKEFDEQSASLSAILANHAKEAKQLLRSLSESVANVESEVWLYRKDLSYFPDAE